MKKLIKPGVFGVVSNADNRRYEFDFYNEQILEMNEEIDYLFIGDSITERWDLYCYFTRNKRLVNRGIGGDISEHLVRRFEADAIQLAPKRIICLIGTNDMCIIDDDLWVPEDKSQPPENVVKGLAQNYKEISRLAKEANIPLTICAVPPSNFVQPFKCEERKVLTLELNEMLKSFAKEQGHDFIDYHSALVMEDGLTIDNEYCFDGVHPHSIGYKAMRDALLLKYPDLKK